MKVSVVIVNWNRVNDLRDTLNSVFSQFHADLEVIVVDNCSTDGSPDMVKEEFQQVDLIQPERPCSACESYNVGMRKSAGDVVAILDNDVILGEKWIRDVVMSFENDLQLGAIASRIVDFRSGDEIWGFGEFTKDEFSNKEFNCTTFIGCAAAIRNRVLREVGYYPEEFGIYANEADLAARILAAGYRIKYVPGIVAYHKASPSQRSIGRKLFYNTRNFIWYYWRYYPFPQVLVATGVRLAEGLFEAIHKRLISLYLEAVKETVLKLPQNIRKRTPLRMLRRRYTFKQLKEDFKVTYG